MTAPAIKRSNVSPPRAYLAWTHQRQIHSNSSAASHLIRSQPDFHAQGSMSARFRFRISLQFIPKIVEDLVERRAECLKRSRRVYGPEVCCSVRRGQWLNRSSSRTQDFSSTLPDRHGLSFSFLQTAIIVAAVSRISQDAICFLNGQKWGTVFAEAIRMILLHASSIG